MKRIAGLLIILGYGWAFGNGFSTLKLHGNARTAGMGLTTAVWLKDGASLNANPSGFAFYSGREIQFTFHRWVEDVNSAQVAMGWCRNGRGLGFHVLYTGIGGIEHRVQPTPEPVGVFSSHELETGFSFGLRLTDHLGIGATVRGLYEKIFISEAWGVAVDMAATVSPWGKNLFLSALVQNIGWTQDLMEEPVSLPLMLRAGIGWMHESKAGGWKIAMEMVKEKEFPVHLHSGVEYSYRDALFLRLGYQSGYDTRNISAGTGFKWGAYSLDYAYIPLSIFSDSHRISFSYTW